MALSESLLIKLSKDELVKMIMNYQEKFDVTLNKIKNVLNDIKVKYDKVEAELHVSKNVNNKLVNQLNILERKCWTNEQYQRRECLEISGISDNISDNDLENAVIKIFNEIDVEVDSSNIEACHGLKSNMRPKKVIVKFSRRKDAENVLKE